jgi:hypothetical protein
MLPNISPAGAADVVDAPPGAVVSVPPGVVLPGAVVSALVVTGASVGVGTVVAVVSAVSSL